MQKEPFELFTTSLVINPFNCILYIFSTEFILPNIFGCTHYFLTAENVCNYEGYM